MTCRAQRPRTKLIGADFGTLDAPVLFMLRSMSMARSSGAAAGTPWNANASRKAGRPAPQAGIVLGQHLVGVEVIRPGQRFCLGDSRAEAVPRNDLGNRVEGVALGLTRCDEGGPNSRIQPDLLVYRARIVLERADIAALGLAEHRSHQPVEQIDGVIREAGN